MRYEGADMLHSLGMALDVPPHQMAALHATSFLHTSRLRHSLNRIPAALRGVHAGGFIPGNASRNVRRHACRRGHFADVDVGGGCRCVTCERLRRLVTPGVVMVCCVPEPNAACDQPNGFVTGEGLQQSTLASP